MTVLLHRLFGTPLGTMLDMGLSNTKIAEITGVLPGGVSKWRTGQNTASVARQMRAKGYLDGLAKSPKTAAVEALPVPAKPAAKPAAKANALYLIAVSAAQLPRFEKLMTIGGFEFVDVDQ